MFGAIARRLVTGGALLLAASLAADAADFDDDLPDLADQIAQMAAEVALELQQGLSASFTLGPGSLRPMPAQPVRRLRAAAQPRAAAAVGPPESGRRGSAQ